MGTIAQEIQRIQGAKADLKTAIEAKGVTVPSSALIDDYADLVEQISGGGGGGDEEKDVNYYDYDGTLLYTYTAQEFAALSAHPANPTHAGLTAQGWNWSLADAKTYVAAYGKLNIGQMYVTDDGKTRIYITIDQSEYMSPTLYFYQSKANGVTVDWGDNSATETTSGTGNKSLTHTYSAQGDYVITLAVTSGVARTGNGSTLSSLLSSAGDGRPNYRNMITKIELGANIDQLLGGSLSYCANLRTISVPNTLANINTALANCFALVSFTVPPAITTFGIGAFQQSYSLTSLCLPNGVTALPSNFVSACESLISLSIPSTVTTLGGNLCQYDYSLEWVTIPQGITTIGTNFCISCIKLKEITIPTGVTNLGATAFSNCKSLEKVVIPNTVTTLEGSSHFGSTVLKSFVIPSEITTLPNYFLSDDPYLLSLTIPSKVTSIGQYAFRALGIESVTIPSSVTSIAAGAFFNCIFLKAVYLSSSTPPTLGNSSAFNSTASDLVIYVPAGSLSAYQSATQWSSLASKMQEYTPQAS